MSSSSFLTRRIFVKLFGTTATGGYVYYKAKYDPPHLIWDLDATILCSVTPLPPSNASSLLDSFDQIDDDFPFEGAKPNTRTYWRPGARFLIQRILPLFTIQHVFTAAQETYTNNILDELDPDRSLFHTIIHRDLVKQPKGKDIQEIISRFGPPPQQQQSPLSQSSLLLSSLSNSPSVPLSLKRCILFDDRIKNFRPQDGHNGLHVVPFEVDVSDDKKIYSCDYQKEYKEILRWTGIAVFALLVPDVRTLVVPYFQSTEHNKYFFGTR